MNRVIGIHAVEQALKAGSGQRLYLKTGALNQRQEALATLAREVDCPIERQDLDVMKGPAQGVVLEVTPEKVRSESELGDLLDSGQCNLVLVLDGVTDPRNLGACLRSAAAFGVDALVIPRDKSATLTDVAIKTASGGASLVPSYQVVNLSRTLKQLQKAGFWVVGTVLDDSQPLAEIDMRGPTVLVMGAEDHGIRQKTRENCDYLARIPMPLQDLSLNVSVATGICLYEISRQRGE